MSIELELLKKSVENMKKIIEAEIKIGKEVQAEKETRAEGSQGRT